MFVRQKVRSVDSVTLRVHRAVRGWLQDVSLAEVIFNKCDVS